MEEEKKYFNFGKFWKSYLISLLISIVIGAVIFMIIFFSNHETFYDATNGVSLAAIVLLSMGGLMYVTDEGFFDVFAYGFKQLGSSMFGKKANANNDFAGYKQEKKTKRDSRSRIYISVLAAGVIFLILMIAFRIAL